jgi:hypothetical protein
LLYTKVKPVFVKVLEVNSSLEDGPFDRARTEVKRRRYDIRPS